MFLCQPCHGPEPCLGEVVKSRGACERCGKVADCIDCHADAHRPKKAEKEKQYRCLDCGAVGPRSMFHKNNPLVIGIGSMCGACGMPGPQIVEVESDGD